MWSTENIRFCEKYIEKQPKTSQNNLFSAVFMVEVATPYSNPARKSALKPFAIRVFETFEKGLILRKNVISIVKNARKCTISVKAKSAKTQILRV